MDYRSIEIDLVHDEEDRGRKLDFLASWRERAGDVRGHAIDCGHFLPEEAPEETTKAVLDFLLAK